MTTLKSTTTLLLLAILSASFVPALAAQSEHIRTEYRDSIETPDSIAFMSLIEHMYMMNSNAPNMALDRVGEKMSITGTGKSAFLESIVKFAMNFDAERSHLMVSLICPQDKAQPYGESLYQIFDDIDDADEERAARYLEQFRKTLSEKDSERFDAWLQDSKLGLTYVKYDHRKSFARSGRDPNENAIRICNKQLVRREQ